MDPIEALTNNINPGIEYELALAYLLIKYKTESDFFYSKVINSHPYSNKILKIVNLLKDETARIDWKNDLGIDYHEIKITTQDDAVGPADIILKFPDNSEIGLSIKFQNKCHLNVTGREFLNEKDIADLKKQLGHFTNRYVSEMTHKYGSPDNWFRKRQRSSVTDEFIDEMRTRVIIEWDKKTGDEKRRLINKIFHNSATIPFWLVSINRFGNRLSMSVNRNPVHLSPDERISLEKHETSFINFNSDNVLVGKMQVKFNNGFLERCNHGFPDIIIENIKAKYGNPFSSWNFSLF